MVECKGVLNETCLTFETVSYGVYHFMRTSFIGYLEFHDTQVDGCMG